jgi:glycosyltransferase involved in cell wall biosynthesis
MSALADVPGVVLAPSAADGRSWLALASAVIAPQRASARTAVLEAMSMARPVVATAAALDDLGACAGRELWRADAAAEFAQAVLAALDPGAGPAFGRAARARVMADHSWEGALAQLDMLLEGGATVPAPMTWPIRTGQRP